MVRVARWVLISFLGVMMVVAAGGGAGSSLGAPAGAAVPTAHPGQIATPAAVPTEWGEPGRVAGESRYATAAAIARRSFPEPFAAGEGVVYLARGDVFADALAGGVLTDGPVLLVRACGALPPAVRAEIDRLDPARVVALGGPEAVCDEALTTAADGRETSRLAGETRYGTAAEIAEHAFPDDPIAEVYLATASDSAPDAVAGGALTAGPILLIRPNGGVPAETMRQIARLDPHRVVALGGPVAVPQSALERAGTGREMGRLAGQDRYGTASAIAGHAFPRDVTVVYLARGDLFADAVAAGSLVDGPVLLVRGGCGAVPGAVSRWVSQKNPRHVTALGGPDAVCEDTLQAVSDLVTAPTDRVELAPSTEVLTPDELDQVNSFDPDTGDLVFGNDEASLASLTEGDIVVAGYTDEVPTGFLRRVEDITVTDSTYELATSEVELPQAVTDTGGSPVGGEATLVASYVEVAEDVEVVDGLVPAAGRQTPPSSVSAAAVEVKLEHTLRLRKQWKASTGDTQANFVGTGTANVDASVKVGGELVTDLSIARFALDELLIKAEPTAEAQVTANITGELEGDARAELGEITRIWHVQVGPVPVVMVEKTDMTLQATLGTSGDFGVVSGIKASSAIGIHYKNGSVSPILTSTGTATSPSLTGETSAHVSLNVGPQTDIRAYGVAGLTGRSGPWAQAKMTMTAGDPLGCTLKAGLEATLNAVAGINILGLTAQLERGRDVRVTLLDEELCRDTTPGDVTITTTRLPQGIIDEPYVAQLRASGGSSPYTWRLTGGTLPAGLTLAADGRLSGTPTRAGDHNPVFTATDQRGESSNATLALQVLGGVTLPFPGGGTPQAFTTPSGGHPTARVGGDGRLYLHDGPDAGTRLGRDGVRDQFTYDEVGYSSVNSWASDGTMFQFEDLGDAVRARRDGESLWENSALDQFFATGFGIDYGIAHSDMYTVDRTTGELQSRFVRGGTWGRRSTGQARATDTRVAIETDSDQLQWFDRATMTPLAAASEWYVNRVALFDDASGLRVTNDSDTGRSTVHFYSSDGVEFADVEIPTSGPASVYPAGSRIFVVERLPGMRTARAWVATSDGQVSSVGHVPSSSGYAVGASENGVLITQDDWDVMCSPDSSVRYCSRAELFLTDASGESSSIFRPSANGRESAYISWASIGFGQVWVGWGRKSHETGNREEFITSIPVTVEGDPRYHSHMLGTWRSTD